MRVRPSPLPGCGCDTARLGGFALSVLLLLTAIGQAAAQTIITDFLDMENGNNGAVATAALAAGTAVGTSGTWTEGEGRPAISSSSQLKISTAHVRPPRGDIQIGGTVLPNNPSTKSYVKKITAGTDFEYIDYILKSPRPLKVSVGMFMFFSSAGDSWSGTWYDYYDLFAMTGVGGVNYLVLSVQTLGGADSTPLSFNIHTDVVPCNSGVELMQASVDKWYWVTMLYDYSGSTMNARMEIYDAETWVRLGAGSCALPSLGSGSKPLWRVSVGQIDNHGNPNHNSDYYMDDFMMDVNGSFPILPKPTSGGTRPAAPQGLRVVVQ